MSMAAGCKISASSVPDLPDQPQYFARQDLALQGGVDAESNLVQPLRLRADDTLQQAIWILKK